MQRMSFLPFIVELGCWVSEPWMLPMHKVNRTCACPYLAGWGNRIASHRHQAPHGPADAPCRSKRRRGCGRVARSTLLLSQPQVNARNASPSGATLRDRDPLYFSHCEKQELIGRQRANKSFLSERWLTTSIRFRRTHGKCILELIH